MPGKVKRNFVGEKNLSRKAASYNLANEVVESGNQESIKKMAMAVRNLANFANEKYDLKNLVKLDAENMIDFAEHLSERVDSGEISKGHATNIISSLNRIFQYYYRDDLTISAKDFGINRGERFNNIDKSISNDVHDKFSDFLTEKYIEKGDIRYEALRLQIELQKKAGLRFKESALFNGRELHRDGSLDIEKGTKGGQLRTLHATDSVKELVKYVKDFRKEYGLSKSLVPDQYDFKQWRDFAYNTVKTFNNENNSSYNFHANRHNYSQLRYQNLTNTLPPVKSGHTKEEQLNYIADKNNITVEQAKELDYNARMQISEELGHHRIDISNYYLGK